MAAWQQSELSGLDNIAYVVAMHEDYNGGPPDKADFEAWVNEHGFRADALLIDADRAVIDAFMLANPGPKYTEAVTVVLDQQMRIRRVGGTYDTEHDKNLELLLQLAAE